MNDENQAEESIRGADTENGNGKRRGRKKGAKNHKRLHAESYPASCPHCGSTDIQSERVIRKSEYCRLRNGVFYKLVVHRRSVCACGQRLVVQTYEN